MKRKLLNTQGSTQLWLTAFGVVAIAVVLGIVLLDNSRSTTTPVTANSCVNQSLAAGASGHCVSDLQNLVNVGAYGIDGTHYIAISGQFDTPTVTAVKVFQTNSRLAQTGSVTPSLWKLLCQAEDPPSSWKTAAKDAGCSS